MVMLFANTFQSPYYEHLIGSSAQHFHEVVRIAEIIEQAMKRGKIEDSVMDSRTMMRDDSGGGWARGKLSLWKVMSLAILSPEHLQNDKWSKMFVRKAGPRMMMNCQLYCYGILSFCILFWDHISFFKRNMSSFFLSLCCFDVRRCLAFHFW